MIEEAINSNKDWKKIFDSIADLIYVIDKDYRLVKINKAVSDFFKIAPEELLGKKCYEVTHKLNHPWLNCPAEKTFADKLPHVEEIIDPRIGTPLLVSTFPVFDDQGELTGVIHIAKDISIQKKAEAALFQNQELLKTVITNLQGIVFSVDKNGVFTLSDGKSLSVLGLRPGQVVGQSVFDVYKDFPDILTGMKKVLAGEPWMGSLQVQKVIFDVYVTPIFDERHKVVGGAGIATDITERSKAEEAVKFNNEIMKNMAEGVYLVSAIDGHILYANQKFEKMFGYGPGEMIGKPAAIVNAPTERDPEEIAREIMADLNRTGSWSGEVHNLKKDGTIFWCYANCSVFEHPEYGKVIVAVHSDITERKQIGDELNKKVATLEKFHKVTVDRELRMKELKTKIAELEAKLGRQNGPETV